jgi:hypothetical protein
LPAKVVVVTVEAPNLLSCSGSVAKKQPPTTPTRVAKLGARLPSGRAANQYIFRGMPAGGLSPARNVTPGIEVISPTHCHYFQRQSAIPCHKPR